MVSCLLNLSSNALIILMFGVYNYYKYMYNVHARYLDFNCTHMFVSLLALFAHSITHELFMVYLAFIIERLKFTIVLTSF